MKPFLLLDFGATRVKAALFDLQEAVLRERRDYMPPEPVVHEFGRYELPVQELRSQFHDICDTFFKLAGGLEGIFICSQMHGFALQDLSNGEVVTEYISWKDERSLEKLGTDSAYMALLATVGARYRTITGMEPRPGLPYFNLAHLVRERGLRGRFRLLSLPDLFTGGERAHLSMLAGSGFFDLAAAKPSIELLELLKDFTGADFVISFPIPVSEKEVVAIWQYSSGTDVPIFSAVGDHQCALLGAGVRKTCDLSVNIGTGSQVSVIAPLWQPDTDYRPFFQGLTMATITHIPAGRALAAYLNLFKQCGSGASPLWSAIEQLSAEEIIAATMAVDLAIFKSAWRYRGGVSISGITEANITTAGFLAGLVKGLAVQYPAAMQYIDPERRTSRLILSGGVPRRIPALAKVLAELCQMEVVLSDEEETLAGLKKLI